MNLVEAARIKRPPVTNDWSSTEEVVVTCRVIGHSWTYHETDRDASFGKLVMFRCTRCDTVRGDTFNIYNELATRSYRYTDEYKSVGAEAKELGFDSYHDVRRDMRSWAIDNLWTGEPDGD